MNSIVIEGRINEEGKLLIADDPDYSRFLYDNKKSRVKIILQALAETNTTLSEWYFEYVVVPKMQQGLGKQGYMFNNDQTIEFIRANCPEYNKGLEHDNRWYYSVIEWCKIYAAENLDVVIKD